MTSAGIDIGYGEYRKAIAAHFNIDPAAVTADHAARYDALKNEGLVP